ncbi:MAG: hypothetical protein LBT20_06350 [Clostridiales bacterium]|jgi:hypothetical protein|nr:hypothetical protein [Clostridiales bacterium]
MKRKIKVYALVCCLVLGLGLFLTSCKKETVAQVGYAEGQDFAMTSEIDFWQLGNDSIITISILAKIGDVYITVGTETDQEPIKEVFYNGTYYSYGNVSDKNDLGAPYWHWYISDPQPQHSEISLKEDFETMLQMVKLSNLLITIPILEEPWVTKIKDTTEKVDEKLLKVAVYQGAADNEEGGLFEANAIFQYYADEFLYNIETTVKIREAGSTEFKTIERSNTRFTYNKAPTLADYGIDLAVLDALAADAQA